MYVHVHTIAGGGDGAVKSAFNEGVDLENSVDVVHFETLLLRLPISRWLAENYCEW